MSSTRAQIITRRTYNRPLNEEGTVFETWPQTVDRCIGHQRWLWERASGHALTFGQAEELEELRELLLARKTGLSGRTFWLGGTDIAKTREVSQFNCLGRETSFITDAGVRKFSDLSHGDAVRVLDHTGVWRDAIARSYGVQRLNRITLSRGRSVQTLRATENHQWVLADGSRTNKLAVGDRLHTADNPMNRWSFDAAPPLEKLYWCYGFVFGDGTLVQDAGVTRRSMVRLCGDKSRFADRFVNVGFSTSQPLSCGGDFFAYTGTYLKTRPDLSRDGVDLVRAFVRGLLDADGQRNPNAGRSEATSQFKSIQATGDETIAWLREVLPAVGVYITREDDVDEDTNFGPRGGRTVRFGVMTSLGDASNASYSVSSIEPDAEEDVWCLDVNETHSFTLPNGITTGNCAFTELSSVHDYVDLMWLLLNGVGGGFWPKPGTLNGFQKPVTNIQIIRSKRTLEQWNAGERGRETNLETWDAATRTWTISVGDSAVAWAKAIGKILAGKHPAVTLVIDLSEIRAGGIRLRGYGWISSGDATMAVATEAIARIMSRKAGRLLSFADLHDIANWCGTVLSTRRSAQIALCNYGDTNWREFAAFKKNYWVGQPQREQSNNSLVFWERPTPDQLTEIFELMLAAGGSEPGFVNGAAARARAPWFAGLNPCGEILLADKGFCNLVTTNVGAFLEDPAGLLRAIYLMGRANYRQTCVDLRDGVLQEKWHQNNEFLRLCGVSLTGQAMRPDLTPYDYRIIKNEGIAGAYSMAVELDMPRPKNVTTGKPEGTFSKCMDATEGAHKPLARYIINNVAFGGHDPLVEILRAANYRVMEHPTRPGDVVIGLPVAWETVEFDRVGDLDVNLESAIDQLNRYKMLMDNYVEQNQSITISYDPAEVPAIVAWLHANWDHYVGVSFLLRADPLKTAADLGYPYLPQQPISKAEYDAYVATLLPVNLDTDTGDELLQIDDCSTGACPIR